MDLKLKDEITKLLIASPGMSISQLAKKTRNYYSYTHKVISEMERKGLIKVSKVKRGNRQLTICNIAHEYKSAWVNDLHRVVKSLLKDAEVKAAFMLLVSSFILTVFSFMPQTAFKAQESMIAGAQIFESESVSASVDQSISPQSILLIIATILLIVWLVRTKKHWFEHIIKS